MAPPPVRSQLRRGGATKKESMLYAHVFDWPQDGKLFIEAGIPEPNKIHLLQTKEDSNGKKRMGEL